MPNRVIHTPPERTTHRCTVPATGETPDLPVGTIIVCTECWRGYVKHRVWPEWREPGLFAFKERRIIREYNQQRAGDET